MPNKYVVGPDGIGRYLPTTPEEDAQAVIDAQAAAITQADVAAAKAAAAADKTRADSIKADTDLQDILGKMKTLTPAQWQSYLASNLTDLASARTIIYRMGLVLMLLAKQAG